MSEPTHLRSSPLFDRANQFGWISIALHWLSAVVIVVLLYLGKTLTFLDVAEAAAQRRLHVSVGIAAWLLIAARIVWRLRSAHPRANGLGDTTHRLAKASHYVLLAALSMMLVSGPLMVWASGASIAVFDWFEVPGPIQSSPTLGGVMHSVHVTSGNTVLMITVLHVSAAFKHLMFHDDESFLRMIWPPRARKPDTPKGNRS